jgi:hypothetical protein
MGENKVVRYSSTKEQKSLINAWGEHLEGLMPDWYLTLTMRPTRLASSTATRRERWRSQVERYLAEVEVAARNPIAWVFVDDFGRGGRLHAHGLVTNVAHLDRSFWWREAFERFGRAEIREFIRRGGAAHYVGKHALTPTGDVHFGGALLANLHTSQVPAEFSVGRVVVARSAEVSSDLFHMNLGRWRQR